MPRAFDSDAVQRGEQPLVFTENVECPQCATVFDGSFHDSESLSVEDVADPPTGTHTCPACGHSWMSSMSGWVFFTEAG